MEAKETRAAPPSPAPHRGSIGCCCVARAAGTKALASPAVRQRARAANIDLQLVAGSGPMDGSATPTWTDTSLGAAAATPSMPMGGAPKVAAKRHRGHQGHRPAPKIADGMMASYSTIPHFSYFEEVDVTELEALRQHLNATRPEGAPKLTYLPFIMQALVKALSQRPECNALYDDDAGVVTDTKPSTSASPRKPTVGSTFPS